MFYTEKFTCPNCSKTIKKEIDKCPHCNTKLLWKNLTIEGEKYLQVLIDKTGR